jgi:hypothetical protein
MESGLIYDIGYLNSEINPLSIPDVDQKINIWNIWNDIYIS